MQRRARLHRLRLLMRVHRWGVAVAACRWGRRRSLASRQHSTRQCQRRSTCWLEAPHPRRAARVINRCAAVSPRLAAQYLVVGYQLLRPSHRAVQLRRSTACPLTGATVGALLRCRFSGLRARQCAGGTGRTYRPFRKSTGPLRTVEHSTRRSRSSRRVSLAAQRVAPARRCARSHLAVRRGMDASCDSPTACVSSARECLVTPDAVVCAVCLSPVRRLERNRCAACACARVRQAGAAQS